jgi:hypothetical protein
MLRGGGDTQAHRQQGDLVSLLLFFQNKFHEGEVMSGIMYLKDVWVAAGRITVEDLRFTW